MPGLAKSLFALAALVGAVATEQLPQIQVDIAPLFNSSSLTYLNITLHIEGAKAKAKQGFLYFNERPDFTPEQRYDANSTNPLVASDDSGAISVPYADQQYGTRVFVLGRDPVGPININFLAQPRDKVYGVAGRNDLRFDGGGAIGQGYAFLPIPLGDDKWNITINWDIPETAPEGTRFSSSLADEHSGSAQGIPSQVLGSTHISVGPVKRWPDWDKNSALDGEDGRKFSIYWISDLPWDIEELGPKIKQYYTGTSKYFGDNVSDFRVFFRRDFEAFGGAGGYHSFILEFYDGSEVENTLHSVQNLLSHEIVHDFALMNPGPDYDKWYVEGIAEYLCSVAPYSSNELDRKTFIQWLNDNAQDYYTASPVNRTWDSLITNYWTQGTAVVKAPYTRGFMYLAYTQGLIAAATKDEHSLDEIVLNLYKKYIAGEQVASKDYVNMLGNFIGQDAANSSFTAMTNGTKLIPDANGFAKYGLKMVRRDLKKFQLGFTESALSSSFPYGIQELVPGSRAEKAGLKKNDKVLSAWYLWGASDTYESKMRLVIRRDGEERTIEYWPRSDELVEAYEWVEAN